MCCPLNMILDLKAFRFITYFLVVSSAFTYIFLDLWCRFLSAVRNHDVDLMEVKSQPVFVDCAEILVFFRNHPAFQSRIINH